MRNWLLDRRAFLKAALTGTAALTALAVAPSVALGASAKRLHRAAVLDGNRLWVGERFSVGDSIATPGRTFRVVGKDSARCLVVTAA